MSRKIIQVWGDVSGSIDSEVSEYSDRVTTDGSISTAFFCLCDDGTIWGWFENEREWRYDPLMSKIPQEAVK